MLAYNKDDNDIVCSIWKHIAGVITAHSINELCGT